MKKMRNLLALAIIGSVLFVSCGDDTTKPVVTLKGASDTTIVLNSTWTDPGAIAEDDEDGVITDIQVTGTVNVNLTGTYVITYSATDAAGNTGTKSRTVRVRNTADGWAGSYSVI
ncbi:MAG: trimeric autotransporter adhesin, partial [Rikenellaceae bacterium]|nr:trimeric autotransporter adhesin [Rikenellaceae bacterium]